jgi:triosephosphate isomerase (TIM)
MERKMKPLILLNFKTYKEVAGRKAVQLARKIAQVKSRKYSVAIAPPTLYLQEVATILPTFAQHVDYRSYGAHTGRVLPHELTLLGVRGVIINHSEHKLPLPIITKTVAACKKQKLITVVCAQTLGKIKKIAHLRPTYIAYEPAAFIGGNLSVTEAKPEIIGKAVEVVKKLSPRTQVLCGAGVHSQADVAHALLLGTQGVLIGHAIPKAKSPQKLLKEMLL